ncbi:hypothetical protein CMV00_02065 [Elizabethkingia anophelis]|nr:hypothetical protein [Elizabethkingia anophelis]
MKGKISNIKDWIYKHPIQFYKYTMIFLGLSFVVSIVQYFYFPSKMKFSFSPPPAFSNSSKQKPKAKEIEMEKIVKELKTFKLKRDKSSLTKTDSLRIDYLFNQYQKLKINGN